MQESGAPGHRHSLQQAMRAASSSRRGFFHSERGFALVSASKSSVSSDGSKEEGGFQWRKRSDNVEPLRSSSPSPSSSSRSRTSEGQNVYTRSFPQRRAAGSANRQEQGGSRQNGSFKSRSSSSESGASYRNKSTYSENGTSKNRSSPENGTSEGKRKKPPKIREQVRIFSPLNKNPNIAILGGGMSGLICALTLQEKGIGSTVFDTGKHGLGGRMGTRHIAQINDAPLVFDHAAQYFTVTDPRFQKYVNQWIAEGVVKEWNGVVGTLETGGKFSELQPCTKYIATDGMRLLADHLLSKRKLIEIKRPCWISRLNEANGMWHLTENEKDHGDFDIVVIAHNGKCANHLLAPIGVPLVAKQMKRLELSSIWALMAAFEQPLPSLNSDSGNIQVDGAFVTGVDALSWMGNNTAKLQPSQSNGPHCWTFFSTAKYGKKNKVPQESIPTVRAERVKREMLLGVEKALGLEEGSLPAPLYMKVQLWGAALPLNTPNVPCIFDAYGRVGICGDWLLGSNLEAAALSGMAMADQISLFCEKRGSNPDEFSIGLEKELFPINGHDIGQFSGQESAHQSLMPELLSTV